MILQYRCTKVESDPQQYGNQTVTLVREDGSAGWIVLSGPDIHNRFVEGERYTLPLPEKFNRE